MLCAQPGDATSVPCERNYCPATRLIPPAAVLVAERRPAWKRRAALALFVCGCAWLTGYETWFVFFSDLSMRIDGKQPVAITEFANGVPVFHAFLMNGDGLRAVSVRIVAEQPASLRVAYKLLRLYDRDPASIMIRTGTPRCTAGPTDYSTGLATTGSASHFRQSRSPTTRCTRLKSAWQATSAGRSAANGRPAVSLMASMDNPPYGGALWIDGVRQPGSLFIAVHGDTIYTGLQRRSELILPAVFRDRAVQALIALALQGAFIALAYGVLFSRADATRTASEAGRGAHATRCSSRPLASLSSLAYAAGSSHQAGRIGSFRSCLKACCSRR